MRVTHSRLVGVAVAVLSLPFALATPIHYVLESELFLWFVAHEYVWISQKVAFLSLLGTCAFVWGVATAYSDHYRSLTPLRAVSIPVFVSVLFLATETAVSGEALGYLNSPRPLSTELWLISSYTLPSGVISAATAPVVASAVRRRDFRWLLVGGGLVGATMVFATTPYTTAMPVFALVFAILPGAFGYVATRPTERAEPITFDGYTIQWRTAVGAITLVAGTLFVILVWVSLHWNVVD